MGRDHVSVVALFVCRFGVHRAPHSFPTRRSSDLGGVRLLAEGVLPARGVAELLGEVGPHGRRQDRKSTRLNSSHTVNSYAVVCLKKKKIHAYYRHASRHPHCVNADTKSNTPTRVR